MTIGWILVGIFVFGLVGLVAYALVKAASDADRAVRRARQDFICMADATITQTGSGSW